MSMMLRGLMHRRNMTLRRRDGSEMRSICQSQIRSMPGTSAAGAKSLAQRFSAG